jgi:hypothetical protein
VSLAILLSTVARSHSDRLRAAPEDASVVRELLARARLFPEVGPGVAAIKRDSRGRYYILAAPTDRIAVYGPAGERVGQIPNTNSHGATIIYALDMDIGPDGRLFVADRGANAVKLFDPDGSWVATIPVVAPTSLVALSGGEMRRRKSAVRAPRYYFRCARRTGPQLRRSSGCTSDRTESALKPRTSLWRSDRAHLFRVLLSSRANVPKI